MILSTSPENGVMTPLLGCHIPGRTAVLPVSSSWHACTRGSQFLSSVFESIIETTIERDKKGGSVSLPLSLIVLFGGLPPNFVSDLETAQLSDSTHFGGS